MKETSTTRLWCGAVAGGTACTLCYPLELIRVRLTVQSSDYYRGILHGLRRVVNEEGLLGLYRGLGVSLTVCVPSLAISFSVYGTIKQWLLESQMFNGVLVDSISRTLNGYGTSLAGAMAGVTSSVLMFPVDVLRKRMQVRSQRSRRGVIRLLHHVVRTEGMRALYRGIFPEVLKVAPMVGIQFMVYEFVLKTLGGNS